MKYENSVLKLADFSNEWISYGLIILYLRISLMDNVEHVVKKIEIDIYEFLRNFVLSFRLLFV
jgi:hypothetical protein